MKLLLAHAPQCRLPSHPSRGAWIEILEGILKSICLPVAPLAGCVD